MDSCGVGGIGAVAPSFGGECDSCTFLKEIQDNTAKMASIMSSFMSSSRTSGAATVGDINRSLPKYVTPGVIPTAGSSPYSWMAENHERLIRQSNMSYDSRMRYTSDAIRSSVKSANTNEKSLRFFSENYYGDKTSNAYQEITYRLKSVGATTSNNLANRLVSMGAALPQATERIYGMLGNAGGEKSWLGAIMESSAVANKQTASNLASGSYDTQLKNILKNFNSDLSGASLAVRDFMHEQNTVNKGIKAAASGLGKIALGGIAAVAAAGISYATSLAMSPNQSGSGALERSTNMYASVGTGIGSTVSSLGLGLAASGVGTPIGLAMMAAGPVISAAGSYLGSKIGVAENTGNALNNVGIKGISSSQVGNNIAQAVQDYFESSVSTSANQALMGFNYGSGRYGTSLNFMGSFNMNNSQRGQFLSQMLLSNRLSGLSTTKAMSDISQMGISGNTYASALSAFQYAPGVVGGQQGIQDLARGSIQLGRISPLLQASDISYQNAGFIGKTRTDALSTALLGESYGGILDDLKQGKTSGSDLQKRLSKTGISLSMLKDFDPDLYNVVAGSGQNKNVKSVDEEMLAQLKELVKIETDHFNIAKYTEQKKKTPIPDNQNLDKMYAMRYGIMS